MVGFIATTKQKQDIKIFSFKHILTLAILVTQIVQQEILLLEALYMIDQRHLVHNFNILMNGKMETLGLFGA